MSELSERFELKLGKLDSLKVYKAFRDFRNYAFLCIDKMPHWVKNSEGVECRKDIRECVISLSILSRSHDPQEKQRAIVAFLAHLDCVYSSLDFFADTSVKALSTKQAAHLALLMDEIERQLARLNRFLVEAGENQTD